MAGFGIIFLTEKTKNQQRRVVSKFEKLKNASRVSRVGVSDSLTSFFYRVDRRLKNRTSVRVRERGKRDCSDRITGFRGCLASFLILLWYYFPNWITSGGARVAKIWKIEQRLCLLLGLYPLISFSVSGWPEVEKRSIYEWVKRTDFYKIRHWYRIQGSKCCAEFVFDIILPYYFRTVYLWRGREQN